MPLKFEKNTDAFLAVLTLVIGTDNVGSLEERDVLFNKVKAIPMFGNPSPAEFGKQLGKVTDMVYTQLPLDDGAIGAAGVDELLAAAKSVLAPDQRQSLIAMAASLMDSDGADASEKSLIEKIKRVLG